MRHPAPCQYDDSIGNASPLADYCTCPRPAIEHEAIHGMFGLSYANMLVLPRTLLQSMPDEWQTRFVALMREYDTQWADLPEGFVPRGWRVQPTEDGKLVPWRRFRLPHYSRGRCRVARDGTINGERFPR